MRTPGTRGTQLTDRVKADTISSFVSRSWQVAWPLTLFMFFEFLIGLTDVYVAGRVGKNVQAAYGFVVQFYFMFIVIANALTVGTVSIVSRLYTSGDRSDLASAVYSSLVSAALAGLIVAGLGITLAPAVIRLLNIPGELKPYTEALVRIYSAGLLIEYIVINSNGVLRSCNMIRVSLRTMAITCAWSMRSMPAMPMAESRPPMGVGITQINSATSTVIVTGVP